MSGDQIKSPKPAYKAPDYITDVDPFRVSVDLSDLGLESVGFPGVDAVVLRQPSRKGYADMAAIEERQEKGDGSVSALEVEAFELGLVAESATGLLEDKHLPTAAKWMELAERLPLAAWQRLFAGARHVLVRAGELGNARRKSPDDSTSTPTESETETTEAAAA